MIITDKPEFILYQTQADGVPEAPITFKKYSDVFEMRGENSVIIVNYDSIKEFIDVLRQIQKNPGSAK